MFVCYIPAFNRPYAYAPILCARYAHKFSIRKNTKKIPHLQEMQDFFLQTIGILHLLLTVQCVWYEFYFLHSQLMHL